MAQPKQEGPVPVPVITPVRSAGWTGAGVAQGAPGWCFAAAEYLVQRAFGVQTTQVEIAHRVLIARGEIGDPQGNAIAYYDACANFVLAEQAPNNSWAGVEALVRADQTLFNRLRNEYGIPPLTGRTSTRTNAPDLARVRQTIDGGGLVLIGTAIHWKVVYGYSTNEAGAVVSYMVYDPWNNGTDHAAMAPGAMTSGIQETYYVTA